MPNDSAPVFQALMQDLDRHIKEEIAKRLRVAGIVGNTIDANYLQGRVAAGTVSLPASGSQVLTTTETIAAGRMVTVGSSGVQYADAAEYLPAGGFALDAITSGANGRIYTVGLISGLSGLTIGATQYLGTDGQATETVPTAIGAMLQVIGRAISATQIHFSPAPPIIL